MRPRTILLTFVSFILIAFNAGAENKYAHLYKDLKFKMPVVEAPVFADRVRSIKDFGGIGDGMTLNTEAFAKAMKSLSAEGGGTLLVPNGIWFTGPIVFQSNINLHLHKGAMILFSPDKNLYPLIDASFEGLDTKRCQSPITAKNQTNIAITGQGTINGNGQVWRPLKKDKLSESDWKKMTKGGAFKRPDYWFPSVAALKGDQLAETNLNVPLKPMTEAEWMEIKDFLRPVMISLVSCKNVLLQGVLFENSPSWNIHPLMCENLIVDNIFARNPAYAQNGDGIDVESCKNSIIVNSTFDVGDDAICIKSGKDEEGRRRGMPTENLIVDNCTVFKGHGGFVVGSEMSGGARNISVKNCKFIGTDVGLRFKSRRGRGGVVENIYISDITMLDISTDAFLFDLFYGGKSASESLADGDEETSDKTKVKVSEETPVFRNIFVDRIVSRNSRRALFFNGLPEMNITGIHVSNSVFTSVFGGKLAESDGIQMKNVKIESKDGAALVLENVKNLKAQDMQLIDKNQKQLELSGKNEKIQVNGKNY